MSGYDALRPLLAAIAAGRPLPSLPTIAPDTADGAYAQRARLELRHAHAIVAAVAAGARSVALDALRPLLDAPLAPTPFETLLEEVGARLARDAHEEELASRFLERRRALHDRFAFGAAVAGLADVLTRPDVLNVLDDALEEPVAYEPVMLPAATAVTPATWSRAVSSFVPFAATEMADTTAYVVTLRHLHDARTGDFAVHRIVWHDLEGDEPGVSDIVLAFEAGAGPLLRGLDPFTLRLRLFFGDGPAYVEASSADGGLFDVEVNPLEERIYLKLRRPHAWAATELPPRELWRSLRSCVLITEAPEATV
jgi:hypothetical protein